MKYVYETLSKLAIIAGTIACLTIAYNYTFKENITKTDDIEVVGDCIVVLDTYEVCK